MTKILIIETSAFWGDNKGGSFVQANYYRRFLERQGYHAEIFYGDKTKGRFNKIDHLAKKLRETDYVVGFGTLLLGVYLQWLCLAFNKNGVFCVDTVLNYKNILLDQLHRKGFPLRLIVESLWGGLHDKVVTAFPPPRQNLEYLASSEFVRSLLTKSSCISIAEKCLYTRVLVKKKLTKKVNKTKKVLFYGASFWGRGVIDLIRACNILWHQGYRFKLVILDRLAMPITQRTIEKEVPRKVRGNIFLRGEVESPEKYIWQATVVVLPFRYPCSFQTPLTLLEPMALGVPVVTTDVGSHGEWIKDGETGIFCEKGNPRELARKIAVILDSRIIAANIARRGVALLRSRYSSSDVLLETLRKYQGDNYRAKREYAKVNWEQYEGSRFQDPAGEIIDGVEKNAVWELLQNTWLPKSSGNLRVLDAATGPGRLAFFLEKHLGGGKITGIDINENMLEGARKIAKKSHSQIIFRQGDLYNLPFSRAQFDAVVGLRFSMHLPNLKAILLEFSRVLEKDGVLVFDVFNADSLLRLKSDRGLYRLGDICQMAEDCGFRLQAYQGLFLLGETILRRCPSKLLLLPGLLATHSKGHNRFSTKLVVSFRKVN